MAEIKLDESITTEGSDPFDPDEYISR